MEMNFLPTDFRKKLKYKMLTKIHPVGAGSFRADGQTDTTNLSVCYRNFTKVPKNESERIYCKVGTSF